MENFELVVNPGSIVENGRAAGIFCKISFKDENLSITGVIGPKVNGGAIGRAGQIDMKFEHRHPKDNDHRYSKRIQPEEIKFSDSWDKDIWFDFLEYWHDYHLNHMKAGCEHQREKGWTTERLSEPCPVCGYKYGSAWLFIEVPENVLSFLAGLPKTKQKPAWV